jgi:hypothetical protein
VLALFVGGAFADYHLYPALARVGGTSRNQGENGLWLRYTWYFGEKSDREVEEMAANLRRRQFRYAYFHVRSIERDGSLKYRYPDRARRLTAAIKRLAPEIKAIAWVYAGNPAGKGEVDLSRDAVRKKMVEEAVWLTTECGFDARFLDLLDETRAALPAGKTLSVAAECIYPGWLRRVAWSEGYSAEVAKRCDQVAVMCYDSGAYTPRLYVWFVQHQASVWPRVAKTANPDCKVILGLPTYGPAGASHNPRAENLRLALKSVREADGKPDGIALFADYTTDLKEWSDYDRWWIETVR